MWRQRPVRIHGSIGAACGCQIGCKAESKTSLCFNSYTDEINMLCCPQIRMYMSTASCYSNIARKAALDVVRSAPALAHVLSNQCCYSSMYHILLLQQQCTHGSVKCCVSEDDIHTTTARRDAICNGTVGAKDMCDNGVGGYGVAWQWTRMGTRRRRRRRWRR